LISIWQYDRPGGVTISGCPLGKRFGKMKIFKDDEQMEIGRAGEYHGKNYGPERPGSASW